MDEILTSHLGYEILQESLSLLLLSSLLSSLLILFLGSYVVGIIWIISWLLKIMLVGSSVLGDPASVLELAPAILSAKQPVEEGGRRAAR